jgi:hypothetical protein
LQPERIEQFAACNSNSQLTTKKLNALVKSRLLVGAHRKMRQEQLFVSRALQQKRSGPPLILGTRSCDVVCRSAAQSCNDFLLISLAESVHVFVRVQRGVRDR